MRTSILMLGLLCFPTLAGDWKSKGEITLESRAFSDDHIETTQDTALGLFARVETDYKQSGWTFRLRGFGRVDRKDQNRDLSAIEEAWLGYKTSAWEWRLGYQMLNWTATEAFHPADIINSRNLDSNIENPEKLGELMLSVRRRLGEGGLTFYYLPQLEDPRLPGSNSRLSFLPEGASYTDPLWLSDGNELASDDFENQWGLRFNQTVGQVDFSLHYVDHLDRQQPLALLNFSSNAAQVTPFYFRVHDSGLTYLHILGGLIFKLEAAHKDFIETEGSVLPLNPDGTPLQHIDHTQIAFGFEYALSHSSGSETTLLFEGQTLEGTSKAERAALSLFQRDLLIGCRHAFNDTMSREILITAIGDTERSHELLLNLSYKQRLSDTWSLQCGGRLTDAPQKGPNPQGLEFLDESNQFFLNVSRYF